MGTAYVTTQTLRFCDTDALGHVNNAVYAVLYEAGRAELMQSAGFLRSGGTLGVVIARLEIDFVREMNWPSDVLIETWFARLGTKSLHVRQRLTVAGEVTSRAASVLAIIDTGSRKAVPIEEGWRASLGRWLVPQD